MPFQFGFQIAHSGLHNFFYFLKYVVNFNKNSVISFSIVGNVQREQKHIVVDFVCGNFPNQKCKCFFSALDMHETLLGSI